MSASRQDQQGAAVVEHKSVHDAPTSVSAVPEITERVVVRRGAFHDPVTLMEASRAARAVPGSVHVAVGMVEPLKTVILAQRFRYAMPDGWLGPNDLLIALRTDGEEALDTALDVIDRSLASRVGERQVRDIGPYVFGGDHDGVRVERVGWSVAEPGTQADLLARLAGRAERIAAANAEARADSSAPARWWSGGEGARRAARDGRRADDRACGPADRLGGMCGPVRGACRRRDPRGAGRSRSRRADASVAGGAVEFAPCHEQGALGPMAGVISPRCRSVVSRTDPGNRAHCNFSEGHGQGAALRRLRPAGHRRAPLDGRGGRADPRRRPGEAALPARHPRHQRGRRADG